MLHTKHNRIRSCNFDWKDVDDYGVYPSVIVRSLWFSSTYLKTLRLKVGVNFLRPTVSHFPQQITFTESLMVKSASLL